jgi:tetratricopeptide (TPR) repeat protein
MITGTSAEKVKAVVLLILLVGGAAKAFAVDSVLPSVAISASPSVSIPVGAKSEYYNIGYGGQASALLKPGRFPFISPRLDLSYGYVGLPTSSSSALTLIRASAGLQSTLSLAERLVLSAYGTVGGYYGRLAGPTISEGSSISLHGGGSISYQFFDNFALTLGADFNSYLGTFESVSVSIGINSRVAGTGGGGVPLADVNPDESIVIPTSGLVMMEEAHVKTVFPVLWKYYDTNPIGHVDITNASDFTLEDVEVRIRPADYVDGTKLSARIPILSPGQTTTVDLFVLFNKNILSISEGTKVLSDIETKYRVQGTAGSDTETITIETYDRNALQWDDDRKIAAFVTAKDDEVQRFARNLASLAELTEAEAVSRQMQLAMLLYEAIIEQGVVYVVDPTSSYRDLSGNPQAVDFVMFPRQTLYVKAGDCDDLSTMYCALLESLGIRSAFITVPGHIFTAFRLEWDGATARRLITDTDNLIFRDDGSVWVPMETTLLDEGFMEAWEVGARQWRRYSMDEKAQFIETNEAWEVYQPVAFSVSSIELNLPSSDIVLGRYRDEFGDFVAREVSRRGTGILQRLESQPDDPRLLNRLGVLYSRYGLYEEAKLHFTKATVQQDFVPALVNIANIYYLTEDYREARRGYEQVLEHDPDHPAALAGLFQAESRLENHGSARDALDRLSAVAPEIAQRYEDSGPNTASDTNERATGLNTLGTGVIWAEEEE